MKNLTIIATLLMALSGCQAGISGKQEIIQSGKSTTEVVLRFEFLQQLQTLCTMQTLMGDYLDQAHYQQAIAQCVFAHLNGAGITAPAVQNFQTQYCQGAPANMTPEQLAALASTCQLFSTP
jgi:hypothetical protein